MCTRGQIFNQLQLSPVRVAVVPLVSEERVRHTKRRVSYITVLSSLTRNNVVGSAWMQWPLANAQAEGSGRRPALRLIGSFNIV